MSAKKPIIYGFICYTCYSDSISNRTKRVDIIKYYFVKATTGKRHIVIAKNEEDLKNVLEKAKVETDCSYELEEDTFNNSGFLISDTE
ncbi:hypothetical protein KYB31_09185 [Clostridium felsineum]|uniref:hypothetical protein n=1 Tax=Clostridium felsineum TaxID=36839 RepID=UPI00214DA955|nr:hypothetical protein [Clostridium felsineum]MCR3759162.1 hypothetical protein [Clostridium felsineum]